MKLATSLIDSLAGPFDPTKYHDTYTEELRSLLEAKAKGKEVEVEAGPEPSAKVTDLMAALQASVDAARSGPPATSKRAPGAKKSGAKPRSKSAGAERAKERRTGSGKRSGTRKKSAA
jgi:DNA end-binding protein Ku